MAIIAQHDAYENEPVDRRSVMAGAATPSTSDTRWDQSPRVTRAVVWTVWGVLLVAALVFCGVYGRNLAWGDEEWKLMPILAGREPLTLGALWMQSGEHRNFLARLILTILFGLTHDFRSALFVHALVLGGLGALMLRAIDRLRGGPSYADVFVPLALLHWGMLFTRLSGVRLNFALGTFFFVGAVLAALSLERRWQRRTAVALGVCVVALPLCAANGLLLCPGLAMGLVVLGARARRARPIDAGVLMGSGALALVLAGYYFVGYHSVEGWERPQSFLESLRTAVQFDSMSLGLVARFSWPVSGVFVIGLAAATLALALRSLRRDRKSIGAWVLLTALLAFGLASIAVGFGRSGHGEQVGHNPRYAPQAVALLCIAYVAWLRLGSAPAQRIATGLIAAAVGLGFFYNLNAGMYESAEGQAYDHEEFQRNAWEGVPSRELAVAHVDKIHLSVTDANVLERLIEVARHAHLPPFDLTPSQEEERLRPIYDRVYRMLPTRPVRARSAHAIMPTHCYDADELFVHAPGSLLYTLATTPSHLTARFGICPGAFEGGAHTDGVTFRVERSDALGRTQTLFERRLDPVAVPGDRGMQSLDIALGAGHGGSLRLITDPGPAGSTNWDWSFWADVRLEPAR